MLIGYNTNIRHKGKTYHVQTEDSGLSNPMIMTLLYHQGAILHSKKTSYSHLVGSAVLEDNLRELMKSQHKEVIKQLVRGVFTGEAAREERKEEPAKAEEEGYVVIEQKSEDVIVSASEKPGHAKSRPKSLDEILLEHIAKTEKK